MVVKLSFVFNSLASLVLVESLSCERNRSFINGTSSTESW